MSLHDAQDRVRRWCVSMFGPSCMAPHERAMRLLEEAIELAQAEGISSVDVLRLANHVYDKPAGKPEQEAGGVGVCLLAWAAGQNADLASVIETELVRIEGKPREHFQHRHRIKSNAGIAMEAEP